MPCRIRDHPDWPTAKLRTGSMIKCSPRIRGSGCGRGTGSVPVIRRSDTNCRLHSCDPRIRLGYLGTERLRDCSNRNCDARLAHWWRFSAMASRMGSGAAAINFMQIRQTETRMPVSPITRRSKSPCSTIFLPAGTVVASTSITPFSVESHALW